MRAPSGARLYVPTDEDGDVPELCMWAMMDLGVRAPKRVEEALDGATWAKITDAQAVLVRRWLKRDRPLQGSTTEVRLDCLTCGACCRRNKVVLDDDDFARWRRPTRRPRRPTLRAPRPRALAAGAPRRADRLHLANNMCGIYALRPDGCRAFPAVLSHASRPASDGVSSPG
ncbi:MAG: YkgJ family cysteine cluster protein [Polyangiales bacterium]